MQARFQFMEAIVRVALKRFSPPQSPSQAVTVVLEQYLIPYASRLDGNLFRTKFLYFEEVSASGLCPMASDGTDSTVVAVCCWTFGCED